MKRTITLLLMAAIDVDPLVELRTKR